MTLGEEKSSISLLRIIPSFVMSLDPNGVFMVLGRNRERRGREGGRERGGERRGRGGREGEGERERMKEGDQVVQTLQLTRSLKQPFHPSPEWKHEWCPGRQGAWQSGGCSEGCRMFGHQIWNSLWQLQSPH